MLAPCRLRPLLPTTATASPCGYRPMPATPRVVRVAVSAYAVRLGLPPTAVEDLRLAVDEALILLLGTAGAPDGAESDDHHGSGTTDPRATDPAIVVTLDSDGHSPPVAIVLQLEPGPDGDDRDTAALARFEELIPVGVAVDVVDPGLGRVALRHPA